MLGLVAVWLVLSSGRVVVDAMHGGVTAEIENAPYMAQLYMKYERGFESFCGASIISKRWVISAAHCIGNNDGKQFVGLEVRVGTNHTLEEGTLYNVSKIIVHEDYRADTRWNNDLCLIKVNRPIEFSESVQPIRISRHPPEFGNLLTVTGYGYDYVDYQEKLKLGHSSVIDNQRCIVGYSVASTSGIPIRDKSFCTDSNQVDLCSGDSGSPAVLDGKLIGVAVEGCESPKPNIFVNLARYHDWVVRNTRSRRFRGKSSG